MLEDYPKISVIIAVYNGLKTLPVAVDSVLSQQYTDVELIIVDGQSTDGTVDYLKSLQAPNVFWKSEPDAGVYDAMNKGIERATGDWIYFLGCDDSFYDEFILQKLFGEKERGDVDLLYGNVCKSGKKYDGKFDQEKLLQRNICHQAIFYKKSLYKKKGIYQSRFKIFADWDFNLRCFFDENIKIQYEDVMVAHFQEGGISSGKDDYDFFRESLFHFSLLKLQKDGIKSLRNIARYDRWWRLLRSMKMEKGRSLIDFENELTIPKAIEELFIFQQKISFRFLQNGFISKTAMAISYATNRFIKSNLK